MEKLFSERNNMVVQCEEYNSAFRSAIVTSFLNQYNSLNEGDLFYNLREVMDLFGIEQKPHLNDDATLKYNKEQTIVFFQNCPWNQLFDFIEYVLTLDSERAKTLTDKYNLIFRMHGCKYRLVGGIAIPIVNDLELHEISKVLNTGVDATNIAFGEALALFSEKTNPDYNAIIAKASNALESMVLAIAKDNDINEKTLSKAINKLENKGISFNQDLKMLIKKIYDYACNAGIRHGGTEPLVATEEDAILIIVLCSTTINYLNSQMLK